MPNDAVIGLLWQAHLGLSLGLLAVLLLRRPWRRLAGVQAAYGLWLLPVWLAAAALLPRADLPGWALPPVLVTGPQASDLGQLAAGAPLSLAGLWAAGVLGVAGLQVAVHRRYRRRLKRVAGGHLLAPAGDSPGLFGLWHARLVLPADFRQRFDASERRWILAHESAHARRLDNPARMFATALAALAWFNPLAWWALSALRQDQELACDAAVMRRYPGSWRRYGLAMLKLDGALRVPPAASAWQSHHPLKERILLLQRIAPGTRTLRAARTTLFATALLGLGTLQTISTAATEPANKGKALNPVTKLREACPQMPRPEVPEFKDLKGQFQMQVKFRIGADGHPDRIKIQGGDPRLARVVDETVRTYGCKAELAGTELRQEFEFRFD